MASYDEFQAELRQLKRERWLKILAGEPTGRVPGRRPRDPDQERLLTRLDRARLARREAAGELTVRRVEAGVADGTSSPAPVSDD